MRNRRHADVRRHVDGRVLSNGAGTATWEILDADPAALESYSFGLLVDGAGASGTANVLGGLGPISASTAADSTSPLPRFADTSAQYNTCLAAPCLTASPAAISVSYQTAATVPAPITIQVGSTGASLPFSAISVATPDGWLSVSPGAGSTPAAVQVTINPVNLTAGVYTATIILTSGTQTLTIPVVVTVSVGPSGYVPFSCNANATITQLRAEGTAEAVGDFVLWCTGGTPTPAGSPVPTVDVTLTLNSPITNRAYANGWTDALLLIDEPNSGLSGAVNLQLACNDPSGSCVINGTGNGVGTYSATTGRPNVFTGKVSGNTVTFPNVPLDPVAPGHGMRVLRITNLRVDATVLPLATPPNAPAVTASVAGIPAPRSSRHAEAQLAGGFAPSITFTSGTNAITALSPAGGALTLNALTVNGGVNSLDTASTISGAPLQ